MGFGYYVLGFLFTYVMSVNPYRFAFLPVGFAFFMLGTVELKKYNRKFVYFIPVLAVAFVNALLGVYTGISDTLLIDGSVPELIVTIQNWLDFAACAAVQILTVIYLCVMSLEVDLPKNVKWGLINIGISIVYYIFDFLSSLGVSGLIPYATLIGVIMIASNFFLLFSCYMRICPEGQEDMSRRPSRFAFINKMNAFRDKKEQETIESSKAYYEQKRAEHKNAKSKR